MTRQKRSLFYPVVMLAISATAILGFTFTYLGPLMTGTYPTVSWMTHAHGIVFLAWCVLLPVQASLPAAGKFPVHRMLGAASLLLVFAMAFTGLLTISIRVQEALSGEGSAFWKAFSIPITAGLVLFLGFYAAALLNRSRPDWHKRFMVVAAATVIAAGTWRIIVGAFGFADWAMLAAVASTKLFIVAGMIHDLITRKSIHPAYWIGLILTCAVEFGSFGIVGSPAELPVASAIAVFADFFGWLY
jgi:hypothetical protein